ncbi:F-box/LRR-repeat protein 13-like [Lotus japonicus]|uniref:F-box/LRR-repeat protein 13-like n=1 Tax=Lotus japonicus TaxID=34305 RepID=UPI00258386F6|nr:F-box/LRR-repeat protein 13-like [Lotus japonicus]XP_057455259.1 F-box/LRR-repeat protein 13-like [Lotus japonicus]XP_057455260.1 F-box/LRR-repeat protein 13-like [Lotus japonicus]
MDDDHISDLPIFILHDILSRLPEKDATRTSVLSKAWWSTFPILSFFYNRRVGKASKTTEEGFFMKRKNFGDNLKKTLLRFRDQGLAIKEFKLSVNFHDLYYNSRDVDLWLKLAGESGVEVLHLDLPDRAEDEWEGQDLGYVLPTSVLEAKSLKMMHLIGGIHIDQAFMNHSIKFFSLRKLLLWYVLVEDEQVIENLISRCPLIEYISLFCGSVLNPGGGAEGLLNSLSMRGLLKLKKVDIIGIQEVYIDSPSLENLYYRAVNFDTTCKLEFERCKNLKSLHLGHFKSTVITQKWFIELFLKFHFLEILKLDNCTMSERICISSDKLTVLMLSKCSNLKEVIIDAPNLSSCQYVGHGAPKPIISFLRSSSQLEVNVEMYLDHLDLSDLREFIQNFKPQNVLASLSLSIDQSIVDEFNPVVLQDSSSPPIIKHLKLQCVPENETLFRPVVNSLLSSCCPETILLCFVSFYCSRAFIEFFYETLMGRKEKDCFCCSGSAKCWWHGLKGVQVTNSRNADENVDFKTMLDALPTCGDFSDIIFRLEL